METKQINTKMWVEPGWEFKMYVSRGWVESTLLHWYTVKDWYFLKEQGDDEFCRWMVFRRAVA